jgi:hypothetical protein
MSSTFKYHSSVDEVIPWQARYTFPTQATKCNKQTVKLVPKNGSTFNPGDLIRIEFPSDNYLNVLNSCLQFDLRTSISDSNSSTFSGTSASSTATKIIMTTSGLTGATDAYNGYKIAILDGTRVQYSSILQNVKANTSDQTFYLATPLPLAPADGTLKGVIFPSYQLQRGGTQNLIKRLRVLYGSLVLEDLQEYKTLVRIFYEAGVDPGMASGAGTILEGLFESHDPRAIPTASIVEGNNLPTLPSTYALFAQGTPAYGGFLPISGSLQASMDVVPPLKDSSANLAALTDAVYNTNGTGYTRKCINLMSGIFTQKKVYFTMIKSTYF